MLQKTINSLKEIRKKPESYRRRIFILTLVATGILVFFSGIWSIKYHLAYVLHETTKIAQQKTAAPKIAKQTRETSLFSSLKASLQDFLSLFKNDNKVKKQPGLSAPEDEFKKYLQESQENYYLQDSQ